MSRFAQLSLKIYCAHKRLILLIPYWITFHIPMVYDAFHVVCEHIGWNAHIAEAMNHSDKQVFLPGVGEELNEHLPAVVADHRKTSHVKLLTCLIFSFDKAPIHLECFTRQGCIPASTVPLRSCHLSFSRNQVPVRRNVILYCSEAARVSIALQCFQAHARIRHALSEQSIQNGSKACQNRFRRLAPL